MRGIDHTVASMSSIVPHTGCVIDALAVEFLPQYIGCRLTRLDRPDKQSKDISRGYIMLALRIIGQQPR